MDRLWHRWPLHFTVAGAVAWLLIIVTYLILAFKVSGGTDELVGLLAFFGPVSTASETPTQRGDRCAGWPTVLSAARTV